MVINNKTIKSFENLNQLDFFKSDIVQMSLVPKDQSEMIKYYENQALNGLVKISIKPFYAKPVSKSRNYSAYNILFIVEGKVVSEDQFQMLNPNDIKTMNVIKDKLEIKKYTSEDYEGIIKITLKK